jgi:type III pantothenate kinase
MNLIAIDIGNTMITTGLYLDDQEKWVRSIPGKADDAKKQLTDLLMEAWGRIPPVEGSVEKKRNGVIVVSSVQNDWGRMVEELCRETLGEKILLIGREIPLPIEMAVNDPSAVGTDRVVNAAAAFSVIEDACVVASFGTAVTIDLVDEDGVFLGGVIAPGIEMGADALHDGTSRLPRVKVESPRDPVGANTVAAINAGLIYSAAGLLRMVVEKFAEQIGKWPHTIVTGGAAGLIKNQCDFVDSWISDLAVRGIVIAFKKHLDDIDEIDELDRKDHPSRKK